MTYFLAIDIGASSGRHILGHVEKGKLLLEEIYRFENNIMEQEGSIVWDMIHLTNQVKAGIGVCKTLGKIPKTIAIDTWAVDYVLLDENGEEIWPCVAYRDPRTNGVPEQFHRAFTAELLYERSGIQPLNFNTLFQIYCDQRSGKLDQAKRLLMVPEYLSYKLTGVMKNEYTNTTTGGFVQVTTRQIDHELFRMLNIPTSLWGDLCVPGTTVGNFTQEIKEEMGFDATVIFCPSHDTASAVAACPVGDNGVYISSGTWSLIGTELTTPITTPEALHAGFTNEGGILYRYRFLKNFMGMWLFQNIRRNLDKQYTYDQMMEMAMASSYTKTIDPNAPEFVAPANMIEAIRTHLGEPELPIGDVLASVYHSLALSYKGAVETIEQLTGKEIDLINIIGGGSKDRYLNQLTKQYTGKRVLAGPTEATATGNLIAQLMADDPALTLEKAREMIKDSFELVEVE